MQTIREKATLRGYASLSEEELLALLLEDNAIAQALLAECGSLREIAKLPASRLRMAAGLGSKRTEKIQLAAEFGRRVSSSNGAIEEHITSSDDVVRVMRPLLKELKYEECWAIYLTSSNRIIEHQRISQGGVQATVVDHRLIIKRALELLATQIILVHNHPSGLAEPSSADKTLTQKVQDAAQLFDIRLLDHIIISRESSYSFRRHNLL